MNNVSLVLKPYVAIVYLLLLSPLIVIVSVSFGDSAAFQFPPTQLSLRWYAELFYSSAFVRAFFSVSLAAGVIAASISTILGVLAAIGLSRYDFRWKRSLEAFFLTPLFVPEILLAAALYLAFLFAEVQISFTTLVASHIVVCAPYVIRSVTAGLAGVDPRLEEAAMSLGASRPAAFVKVTVPLLQSSIVSGAVFAFIISFSDINLALFLAGPDAATLPMYIYSQIQYESTPAVAAAATLQVVVIGFLIVLVQKAFKIRALL